MNDVEDENRGIDVPGTLGGSGVLQAGLVPLATMRKVAWGAFGIGLLLGVPALVAEPALLGLVAVAALGAKVAVRLGARMARSHTASGTWLPADE